MEESNNAARLRLARIKRQVEKLRIERAFLLEQLAKRTSANVEDSDGSPSPPPTVRPTTLRLPLSQDADSFQPKDKPLRIKRGHRKASPAADADSKSVVVEESPSKKSASAENSGRGRSNGAKRERRPSELYELYASSQRAQLYPGGKVPADLSERDPDIEEECSSRWRDLGEDGQRRFEKDYDKKLKGKGKQVALPEDDSGDNKGEPDRPPPTQFYSDEDEDAMLDRLYAARDAKARFYRAQRQKKLEAAEASKEREAAAQEEAEAAKSPAEKDAQDKVDKVEESAAQDEDVEMADNPPEEENADKGKGKADEE